MGLARALMGGARDVTKGVAKVGIYAGVGAGILAAPGIAGMVMASQESASDQAVAIGAGTAVGAIGGAGLGAVGGTLAGAVGARLSSKIPGNRPYGKAMKIGALAGAASAGILSTALVGRGLSSTVHAPRRLNPIQGALPQYQEGGIRGMDL